MALADRLELRPVSRSVVRLQRLAAAANARLWATCPSPTGSGGDRPRRSRSWSPEPQRQARRAARPRQCSESPRGRRSGSRPGDEALVQPARSLSDAALPSVVEKAAAAAAEEVECSVSGVCSCAQLALFKARLRAGRLHTSLAALVEVELTVGTSLPAAVALVRDAWKAGGIRLHGGVPEALKGDLFGRGRPAESVVQGVLSLEESRVSVTLNRLSWLALRAVLLCFRRQRLRPTLGLLREMCRAVFALDVSDEDLLAAVCGAPLGACRVDYAPWPILHAPFIGEKSEQDDGLGRRFSADSDGDDVRDYAIVQLEGCELDDCFRVFPPYCAELQSVVEEHARKAVSAGLFRDLQCMMVPDLTLPKILMMAAAADSAESLSGGALLWLWEKARAPARATAPQKPLNARTEARKSNSDSSTAGSLLFASEQSTQSLDPIDFSEEAPELPPAPEAAAAATPAGPVRTRSVAKATEKEDNPRDSQSDGCSDRADAADDADAHLHPTPHEAFAACFAQELLLGREVALSQINNLYRMRSGGYELRYRNRGYLRMCDFLAEVPGLEFVGSGNKMSVRAVDPAELSSAADRLVQSMANRAAQLRATGQDAGALEVVYRQPKAVPDKILARVWDIFQEAPGHEMLVSTFVSLWKERYRSEKSRLSSLGFQEVRGLMAYVPFIEKLGSRGHAKYVLKPGSTRPELPREGGRQQGRRHIGSRPARGGTVTMAAARVPF